MTDEKSPESRLTCGLELPCPIHDTQSRRPKGMTSCRFHGWVPYEHTCRRPDESAMEYTSRCLGESRDV